MKFEHELECAALLYTTSSTTPRAATVAVQPAGLEIKLRLSHGGLGLGRPTSLLFPLAYGCSHLSKTPGIGVILDFRIHTSSSNLWQLL